jgi:hypothetical protein
MWCNDIDIELRYPSWSRRPAGIAPGRHRAALDRYLERQRKPVRRRSRGEFKATFGKRTAWVLALAARLGRHVIGAKPGSRRATPPAADAPALRPGP